MSPWLKLAVALAPLMLAALIGIAWNNSHSMAVLGARLEDTVRQLDHVRDMVEQRVACGPRQP
jgi:hypothetical protein